ncbi:MAG TPA: MFS transporter [Methylobacter sp.]|jgi:MFS family permease
MESIPIKARSESDVASTPARSVAKPVISRWAIAAAVTGNAIEFFDFLTYSFYAVYIGRAFFPAGSALFSLLLSLATFGVGFVTRPLGGFVIGAFADRAGRRPALMLTISLMTIGTMGVALTPSYARIGMAAPIILVLARLVQGLALGGEVGPSTALLLEAAPAGRGGAYVSWQGASQGIASLVAGLAGLTLALVLDEDQLSAWGWRLPFLFGLLIVPVGLYIRRSLPETLEAPSKEKKEIGAVRLIWRHHQQALWLGLTIVMCQTISAYVSSYMTTYALTALGMSSSKAMLATVVQGGAAVVGALLGGRLSDRFGRKPLMIIPRALLLLAIFPAFQFLTEIRTVWALTSVTAMLTLLTSVGTAASMVAMVEIFPNAVRSSGMSITNAVSVSLFGGTTQFVIAWLIGTTGNNMSPAYYVIVSSMIGIWAMYKLPETRKK